MDVHSNFEDFHSIPVTKPTTRKWRSLGISPYEFHKSVLKSSESNYNNYGIFYSSTSTCRCCSKAGCCNQVYPIKWCTWKKPQMGWIKLNTDGSMSNGCSAAIGGLLRDYKGVPLCAYFTRSLDENVFTVELSAIWRGLLLALSMRIRFLWIESDSLSVVKTINGEQPDGASSNCYLDKIRNLLVKFTDYRVTHTWREANKAADYISRMDVGLNDVVFWPDNFPDMLHNIIMEDAESKIYFRH